MKLAVTGITSGVGRRFAEIALCRGHEVRGLVRDESRDDARALARLGVELTPGDLLDPASLSRLCRDVTVVVHMAAHVGDWGPEQAFVRVNVEGTRKTLDAAVGAAAKRFVQLSSVAVYGRPERGRVTEAHPTRKSGAAYDDTKTEAERLVFARSDDIETSAVRPPLIYGPYDRNFIPRALRLCERRVVPLIDGGRGLMNVASVDHVVDVLLLAAERPEAVGEAFNVSDRGTEKPPTVREVMETIAEAGGHAPRWLVVPKPIAALAAHALDRFARAVSATSPPPLTPLLVQAMTHQAFFDAKKAIERLGWQPQIDPLCGLHAATKAITLRR